MTSIRQLIRVILLHYLVVPQVLGNFGFINESPKDYAQSFTNSRVGGLINFFELVHKSSQSVAVSRNTNIILSLSEAASKLYTLVHGKQLEQKCDKYIKLLSRPNIRTIATISVLMKEGQSLSDISQRDSNLIAKLVSEREFDALARIQTILQTLEMETVMGKSSLEPNVEKDLLDCVNYYTYRHQRATADIIQHVRESRDKLSKSQVASGKHEVTLRKLAEAIDNARALEQSQGRFQLDEWIKELTTIHQLALENDFELPERVQDFLMDRNRIERLHLIDKGEELRARLLQFESLPAPTKTEYKKYIGTAKSLQEICEEFTELIPETTCSLMKDAKRLKLIRSSQFEEHPKESFESIEASGRIHPPKRAGQLQILSEPEPIGSPAVADFNHDVAQRVPVRLDKFDGSDLEISVLKEAPLKPQAYILSNSKGRVQPRDTDRALKSQKEAPAIEIKKDKRGGRKSRGRAKKTGK